MVASEREVVPNSVVKRVLEYAASTLEYDNEVGEPSWVKGSLALDHLDRPCDARSVKACAWCLWGALLVAGVDVGGDDPCPEEESSDFIPAACAAADLLAARIGEWRSDDENALSSSDTLGYWNDEAGRTLSEVLSVLQDAIVGLDDVDDVEVTIDGS